MAEYDLYSNRRDSINTALLSFNNLINKKLCSMNSGLVPSERDDLAGLREFHSYEAVYELTNAQERMQKAAQYLRYLAYNEYILNYGIDSHFRAAYSTYGFFRQMNDATESFENYATNQTSIGFSKAKIFQNLDDPLQQIIEECRNKKITQNGCLGMFRNPSYFSAISKEGRQEFMFKPYRIEVVPFLIEHYIKFSGKAAKLSYNSTYKSGKILDMMNHPRLKSA